MQLLLSCLIAVAGQPALLPGPASLHCTRPMAKVTT